jgi:hypothetical protein
MSRYNCGWFPANVRYAVSSAVNGSAAPSIASLPGGGVLDAGRDEGALEGGLVG